MKMFLLRILITIGLLYSTFAQDVKPEPTDPVTETTAETTTTTSTTITTTTPKTTTTTTTTTTTAAPPTTEAPVTYNYYNYTGSDGVVCIMLDGNFKFKIEYNIANKTNTTEIEVPKPSSDVNVTGSCKESDGTQYILISWGSNRNSLKFVFTDSKDHLTWTIGEVTSVIYIDSENFPNATDVGKSLTSNITLELTPSEVPVNKSYKCFSNSDFNNSTTTEDGTPYNHSVSLHVSAVQFEAFNRLPSKDKFVDEIHCDADKVADIVPIAVGCALAGLIIIVLIAYIVGRRRRSASYQSV